MNIEPEGQLSLRGQRVALACGVCGGGATEAAVLTAATDGAWHVLIHERTPQPTRSLVVSYSEPGVARLVQRRIIKLRGGSAP